MIRDTFIYALSVAFMRGMSLIMLPFVAFHLSPEELGKVEILASLAILGSVIVGMGLEHALYRFVGQANNEDKDQIAAGIFTLALLLCIISLSLLKPLTLFLQPLIPGDIPAYCIALVLSILAFESMLSVPLAWLRMKNKAELFCLFSIVRVGIYAVLTFTLIKLGRGIYGVFEANAIAVFAQAFLLFMWQLKNTGLYFCSQLSKKVFIYSFPLVGSGLLAFGLMGFDRWSIADNLDMASVATYGIAAKFSIALTMLMQPYGMWWMPKRFELLNEENGIEKVSGYATIGLLILLAMGLFIGLATPIVIHFLFPQTFVQAVPFALGLILAIMLKEAVEFTNMGCFLNKRTDIQLKINIITTALACAGITIGVKYFGLWGVVLALFCSHALRFLLFYFYSQKSLAIKLPVFPLAKIFIIVKLGFTCLIYSHYQMDFSSQIAVIVVLPFVILALSYKSLISVLYTINLPKEVLVRLTHLKARYV